MFVMVQVGSPTIVVSQIDLFNLKRILANPCRVYRLSLTVNVAVAVG